MAYRTVCSALQAPGLPWPAAAGGPGPGGHYKLSDKPLAGLLIIVCVEEIN